MGTCQCLCKQQSVFEHEITIQHKHKHDSDRDQKTDHVYSSRIVQGDMIGEEFPSDLDTLRIAKKIKTLVVHTDRKNRFMHDLEEEVKYRIRQIQQEEQENILRVEQLYYAELKKQKEQMENQQKAKAVENQFSFQNSMNQSEDHQSVIPFQPKSTSQFAPKRNDNDTVSQHSQISKNQTTPNKEKSLSSQSDVVRKSALLKIMQAREELGSNNASKGSTKKKMQLEAYERMFSEFFSQDSSSHSRTSKSKKSILKNKSLTYQSLSGGRAASIKSTHTVMKKSKSKSKKVRFSKDTNFTYERKGLEPKRKNFWDF